MQFRKTLVLSFVISMVFSGLGLRAQTTDALGSYSPYSMLGIGDVVKQGTAYNYGMAGIGVGVRDNGYINYTNPAAIAARDTLSFMLDFGITQKNFYISDYQTKSAYNVFNMNNFAFTAPIYKKSAFIIGVSPFSNTGYKFESVEQDDKVVSELGDIRYRKYGTGSINQLFLGASVVLFKYFSLGAEAIYYFGSIDRHSDALFNSVTAYNSIYTGWEYNVGSFSGKFGLQYNQPFKNNSSLTIGVTYRLGNELKGDYIKYAFSTQQQTTDTVSYTSVDNAKLKIAPELAAGISYRHKDKWMLGFDYVRQDWTKSAFISNNARFDPKVGESFRMGFEIVPNRYDIRYYAKRMAYRGGVYFDKTYIGFNDKQVMAFGITLGTSLPIYKWHNAVSLAIDMGQRGTKASQLVRERYINFMVNINLHDIWFVKYRYD
jgi:hypothetical protein